VHCATTDLSLHPLPRHRYTRNVKQRYWGLLVKLLGLRRILMKRAMYHHRVKVERVYFYPWRQWAFMQAQGIARK
jgi:hypothetical protein